MPKTPDNEEEASVVADPTTTRLDAIEQRLKVVEQAAHTGHDLALGEKELSAICDAILPYVNKHLGISGQPARGDQE